MSAVTAPLLVFGYGNPGRGDDALGPVFIERLRTLLAGEIAQGRVELLTDFQLQPEHALDLRSRERVLFVDASATAEPPYRHSRLEPGPDASAFSHAMTPAALLQVYERIEKSAPPPATLLAIRGDCFELGAPLGKRAHANLAAAIKWALRWIGAPAARQDACTASQGDRAAGME